MIKKHYLGYEMKYLKVTKWGLNRIFVCIPMTRKILCGYGTTEWIVRDAHEEGKGLVWALSTCLFLILQLQYYFSLAFCI